MSEVPKFNCKNIFVFLRTLVSVSISSLQNNMNDYERTKEMKKYLVSEQTQWLMMWNIVEL